MLTIPTAAHVGYSALLAIWIKFFGASVISKNGLLIFCQTITAINCSLFITKINNAKSGLFLFSLTVFLFYSPFIVYTGINDSQQLAWLFISAAILLHLIVDKKYFGQLIILLLFIALFFIADLARTSSMIYGALFLLFFPIFRSTCKKICNIIINLSIYFIMFNVLYFILNTLTSFKWDHFTAAINITALGLNYGSGGTWYPWTNDFLNLISAHNIESTDNVSIIALGIKNLLLNHNLAQIIHFFWNKLFVLWSGADISSLLRWSYVGTDKNPSTFVYIVYFCNKFIFCIIVLALLLRKKVFNINNNIFDNYVLVSTIYVSILHLIIEVQGRYIYIVTPLIIMLLINLYYDYYRNSLNIDNVDWQACA